MTKGLRIKRRAALSSEQIVTEALALVEDEGLEGFSFRKLAKRLGCEAMSIYHYFASKQHLYDAMVTRCLDDVAFPDPDLPSRDWMLEFCRNYRTAALKHPGFALILSTHRLNHRDALARLDQMVAGMAPGVPTQIKATLFRVISYYLTGAVIDEALGYTKGPSAAEPYPAKDAARDFPHIMGIGAFFGREFHEMFFETGLAVLLDWYDAEIAKATTLPLADG